MAGFVTFKFRNKYPDLAEKTGNMWPFIPDYCPWISMRSRGGLRVPSKNFLSLVFKVYEIFCKYHGDKIRKSFGVKKQFHELMCKTFPNVPADLLFAIVKTLTHIRVREINLQLKKSCEEARHGSKVARAKKQIKQHTT